MSPQDAVDPSDVVRLNPLQVAAQAAERAVLQQQLRAAESQRDRLSGVLQRVAATEGDVEAAIARLDSMVRAGCV